jgi:3-ketoacyl-CoA synthase
MYSEEMKDFLWRVLLKSGLSTETTYLPPAVHPCHVSEPRMDIPSALEEARMVICGAADELFQRTGISPQDIDIVITSNSIFCPTPRYGTTVPTVNRQYQGGTGSLRSMWAASFPPDL